MGGCYQIYPQRSLSRFRGDTQNRAETNLSSKVKKGLVPTSLGSLPLQRDLSNLGCNSP